MLLNYKYIRHYVIMLLAVALIAAPACKKESIDIYKDFGSVTIDSVSPGTGPAGYYVEIYGKNFTYLPKDVQGWIGNSPLVIKEASVTRLLVQLPADAATGNLRFWFNRFNAVADKPFNYTGQVDSAVTGPVFTINSNIVPLPVVQDISNRTVTAGDTILITGYNFSVTPGTAKVLFGDMEGEIIEISTEQIKVRVPLTAPLGAVKLLVQQGGKAASEEDIMINELLITKIWWSSLGRNLQELNGTQITTKYEYSGYIWGIAADRATEAIYFVNGNLPIIEKTNNGTSTVIYDETRGLSYPLDIALNAAAGELYISDAGVGKIFKGSTDGSSELQTVFDLSVNGGVPGNLKRDPVSGDLFWVDFGTLQICRGKADGSSREILFDAADGITQPAAVGINFKEGRIYIVDGREIKTGNLSGEGGLTKIYTMPDEIIYGFINDLEVDEKSNFVYWVIQDSNGKLMRMKGDGSQLETLLDEVLDATFLDIKY